MTMTFGFCSNSGKDVYVGRVRSRVRIRVVVLGRLVIHSHAVTQGAPGGAGEKRIKQNLLYMYGGKPKRVGSGLRSAHLTRRRNVAKPPVHVHVNVHVPVHVR